MVVLDLSSASTGAQLAETRVLAHAPRATLDTAGLTVTCQTRALHPQTPQTTVVVASSEPVGVFTASMVEQLGVSQTHAHAPIAMVAGVTQAAMYGMWGLRALCLQTPQMTDQMVIFTAQMGVLSGAP